MPVMRFELMISCLRSKRFTTKLHRHIDKDGDRTREPEGWDLETHCFDRLHTLSCVWSPPTRRIWELNPGLLRDRQGY